MRQEDKKAKALSLYGYSGTSLKSTIAYFLYLDVFC